VFFFRLLILVLLSIRVSSGWAQVTWENQAWTSLEVERKINKSLIANLGYQMRWSVDAGMAVTWFPEFSLKKKWNRNLNTIVHFRYLTRNEGLGQRTNSARIMLDGNVGGKLRKTGVGFRLREGREDETESTSGLFSLREVVIRQKLKLEREFFGQDFSISAEQFETIRAGKISFDQRRFVVESDLKLSKQHYLNLFIMYQDLIDTRRINVGTGYRYRWK